MAREWSYWTKNKLEILRDYLPIFNMASRKSSERIYLDLMAGQPENIERYTGASFDGSPVIALQADPAFTKLRFGELGSRADSLRSHLAARFPGDTRFTVVKGDCNSTIDGVLQELMPIRWAPTFAFVDQQAAEVHWETIEKLARFRRNKNNWKTELWLLMSPAMIAREARRSQAFRDRVSRLYGNDSWLRILSALDRRLITAQQYRQEMVNLMRYQLEFGLGYTYSHRIPMQMHNKVAIFDMVFASDHEAGDRIMRDLYNKAARREPEMMRQAKTAKAYKAAEETGELWLFEANELKGTEEANTGESLWSPSPCWDPADSTWWHD